LKKEELRAMTEEEAYVSARRLSSDVQDGVWIAPERRDALGLIEQQRLFAKLRQKAP
jgi:hypothetical protein